MDFELGAQDRHHPPIQPPICRPSPRPTSIPLGSLLKTDQTEPKKKAKKRQIGLSLIVGRQGQGPFDWVSLAQKLMITLSLMEFWHIRPQDSK
ncbi:hypothetical protein ColLi_13094 [Colletotrichum liriopes]|uniref:Uncharacterized protein n=1 Tax=Colletotrichum liriopes TaxID=708192 RepID=A0AA37GZK2_9PEZI|nr:hypothetical protein ColLi_13094 [Colletotrichum liriopes]